LATVETVIDRLVSAGLNPANIVVFGADEADMFNAGFNINHDGHTVRVLGSESEGFRGGISRIVSDYCDALINIATLRVDPELGFSGCVANTLVCVPMVQRVALRQDPRQVGSVAALPVVRQKLRLNLLEAYLPLLDQVGETKVTCQYRGLLAGADAVAVDEIGRQVLQAARNEAKGYPWPLPQAADYLQAAQDRYRVGQADPKAITVKLVGPQQGSYLHGE
jgi:Domain of unknown function (DUF362)